MIAEWCYNLCCHWCSQSSVFIHFRFEDDGDYFKHAGSLDEAEDDFSENTEDDQSIEYHENSDDECGKTGKSKDSQGENYRVAK